METVESLTKKIRI